MRLLVAILPALLLAPFTASAQKRNVRAPHGNQLSQVIHACVNRGGLIRIVSAPDNCGANQTPVSWNVQGPPGPPGAPGEPGTDGEPGPQGPPGPSLRVFDALGTDLGLLAQWNTPGVESRVYRVYLASVEATVLLDVGGTLVIESPGGQIFFEGLDCTGQAFVERRWVGRVTGEGGRLFIGRGVPSFDPEYQSRLPSVCNNDQASGPLTDAVPADEITLDDLGLSFPRPGPLYIGLPPQ